MRNRNNVSIKDIARLSGVSVATVSRVINHNGRFSEETRQRVEQVIADTHYSVNLSGKNLREQKTKTIGILVPDITNELFAHIVLELEKYFFERGYSVLICNSNEDEQKENAYFSILKSKQVDGIICISGSEDIPEPLVQSNLPIVCIDRKPKSADRPAVYVESDHYIGGYIATELLIKKGCKKIVILSKQKALSVNVQRLNGYLDALRDYHLPIDEALIVKLSNNISNFEESRDIIFYMIKKGISFDGVFATNDWRAYGALTGLQQSGIAVPEQVKLVGFDGTSVSKFCYPAITTIQQNKKQLATQAASILLGLIDSPDYQAPNSVTVPVSLVERGTT